MRNDLKEARTRAGLTQVELGAAIGKGQDVISRYESGKLRVDADTAKRLAEALSLPVLDVLYAPAPPAKAA